MTSSHGNFATMVTLSYFHPSKIYVAYTETRLKIPGCRKNFQSVAKLPCEEVSVAKLPCGEVTGNPHISLTFSKCGEVSVAKLQATLWIGVSEKR